MIFAPKHPANCMKINRNWSVFGAAAHSGAEMKRYAKISFARNHCRWTRPAKHIFPRDGATLSHEDRSTRFKFSGRLNTIMQIRDGITDAIGHTPLIKLERASAATGCIILGKAEFMNPGGSVKDRPALQIILEGEKRGDIKRGGLVVEGTAGNTGIGLALVANARGYRTLIVIPNTQSQEKKDMLRLCGAELVEVPALPYSNPDNYQHIARRLAEKLRKTEPNGVLFADQWNNRDNRKAHYLSTGPEIWEQTNGKVDGFICAVGTGGTLAGTSIFLREKKKDTVIGVADPRGAAMFNLFSKGEAKSTEGGSVTEGIGLGRVTPIIDDITVDKPYLIPDEEAVPVIFDLLEHEGLCLGGSSGINVAGAIRLAKDLGPGHTIVTVLCDSGTRYQSKLFNAEFLRSKKLPVPAWLERKTNVEIPFAKG
jgi:cysteine synthase A